jgi:uncharacterized protein (TIGR02001 family)
MRNLFTPIVLIFLLASAPARADTATPLFYGYVQLMNNYVSRGLSQSVGEASAQAEIDVNAGAGPYLNLGAVRLGWVDKLYPGDSVHVEVDGIVGYRVLFDDGQAKFGVLRIQLPGHYATGVPLLNTTEAFGYVAWKNVSARLNVSVTDAFATPNSRGAWYLDLNATQPLGEGWSALAHYGRRQSRGTNPVTGADNAKLFSYNDYKVGVARDFGHGWSLTAFYSYADTDPKLFTLNNYDVGGGHLSAVLEKDF